MTGTDAIADLTQSEQGKAEVLSLTDVFELSLGEAVFHESGARIKITKLRPMILRDDNDVCCPGIVLAVEGTRFGNPFNHNNIGILLMPDGTNELVPRMRPKEFFEPLAESADLILDASGFNREAVFENLDFERTVIVPEQIAVALGEYAEFETEPEWDNPKDQELWENTKRRILDKTEGDQFVVNYIFKDGYSPEQGDLYLVSAVAAWKLYDAPDVPYKTFETSEKLTQFQAQALDLFLAQTKSSDALLDAVNNDIEYLPSVLLMTARQTLGYKEINRRQLIHRSCG